MGDISGTETSTAQETRHKLPTKTLLAASIGNAIEWYDWTVFATFLIYFSTQFFPAGNPELALLNTTATYAVAFFFRPVGGWMLGRFADVQGRKAAMILTITLMAGGVAGDRPAADLPPGRVAGADPAAGRPHLAGAVAGW